MEQIQKPQVGLKVFLDWDGPSVALISRITWDGKIELSRYGGEEKILLTEKEYYAEVQSTSSAKWKEILAYE